MISIRGLISEYVKDLYIAYLKTGVHHAFLEQAEVIPASQNIGVSVPVTPLTK